MSTSTSQSEGLLNIAIMVLPGIGTSSVHNDEALLTPKLHRLRVAEALLKWLLLASPMPEKSPFDIHTNCGHALKALILRYLRLWDSERTEHVGAKMGQEEVCSAARSS